MAGSLSQPASEAPTRARVAFARIEAQTLPPNDEQETVAALFEALTPGTQAERYGRAWRMGQTRPEGKSLVGRIGFQGAGVTELWNEEVNDFEEALLDEGTTSPFAIDPRDLRVVFQVRAGLIRARSFTGALQALMNESSPFARWRVTEETEEADWNAWLESVDRVTTLRVKLERPNPNYHGRSRVEGIVEGANARMAELVLKASDEALDGIDVNDVLIAEAIEHAGSDGSWSAVGEQGDRELRYRSDEPVIQQQEIEANPATREAESKGLRRELGDSGPDEIEEHTT